MLNDNIAAVATGMTDAGIGIIRISGPDAIIEADKIFKSKTNKKLIDQNTHTMHFGFIIDENNNDIDEVLVSIMKAPHSYTGENTVEINSHGGIFVINKILEIVLKCNIRLAEPGEFTKRAFLNGKMDLSKAEAVMDLISAKNDFAVNNSMKQIKGSIYNEIISLREKIIYEIAFIESAIDDPEHFDLDNYPKNLSLKIKDIINRITKLIDDSKNGKIRKDGISTVIVGKPNAGKSSFMNLLLGEDRAIVTSMAGTTRDILQESVKINDIILNIIDTAGIRDTDDEIEKIGVEKARKYAKDADLLLYMVDSSVPLDENDDDIIELLNNRNFIVLMNKSDLKTCVSKQEIADIFGDDVNIVNVSAKENLGIDDFSKILNKMFFNSNIILNDEVIITNLRQRNELIEARNSLNLVLDSINNSLPEDFYSIDLQNAYMHLGLIIGEEIDDDVAETIFSKFCMGK